MGVCINITFHKKLLMLIYIFTDKYISLSLCTHTYIFHTEIRYMYVLVCMYMCNIAIFHKGASDAHV